jgi:hypothetical protein
MSGKEIEMAKGNDLSAAAAAGFAGGDNPHIYSSPNYYAFELGKYLQASGRCAPRDVRMGRGDSIRANDMRFAFKGSRAAGIKFERVE